MEVQKSCRPTHDTYCIIFPVCVVAQNVAPLVVQTGFQSVDHMDRREERTAATASAGWLVTR